MQAYRPQNIITDVERTNRYRTIIAKLARFRFVHYTPVIKDEILYLDEEVIVDRRPTDNAVDFVW